MGEKITIFLKKLIVFFYTAAAAKSIQNSQTCCFLFNSYPVDTTGTTQFNGVMGMSKRTSKSPSNSRPQSPTRAQKRKLDEREPGEIIRSPRESTEVYPSKRQTREDAENISGIWHIPLFYQTLPKKERHLCFKIFLLMLFSDYKLSILISALQSRQILFVCTRNNYCIP